MGTTPRFLATIETLHPYFEKAFAHNLESPDFHSGSMAVATWFAEAHGREGLDSLPDSEIQDLCVLLEGLSFPVHPSEMALHNKYGCDQCRVFYEAIWDDQVAATLAVAEEDKAQPDLTSEQMTKLTEKMLESEKFLEG